MNQKSRKKLRNIEDLPTKDILERISDTRSELQNTNSKFLFRGNISFQATVGAFLISLFVAIFVRGIDSVNWWAATICSLADPLSRILSEERRANHQKEASIRERMEPALAAANSLFKKMLDGAEGCANELVRPDMSLGIIDEQKKRIAECLNEYAKWYEEFGGEIEQFLDYKDKELKKQLKRLLAYSNKVIFCDISVIGSLAELINILQACRNRGKELYEKLYFS